MTAPKTRTDASVVMGIRTGDEEGPLTPATEAKVRTRVYGCDFVYDFATRTHVVGRWTFFPASGAAGRHLHKVEHWPEGRGEYRAWVDDYLEEPGTLECRWTFDDGSEVAGTLRIVP